MMRNLIRATRLALVLMLLTGVVYPLVMTGVAQLVFRDRADGSLVRVDDRVVGSRLIGQAWEGPEWFYGRPSEVGYDATTSGGSNLGPTSEELADRIRARAGEILAVEGAYVPGLRVDRIPPDLLLASGSGLDPHISPAAAMFQAPRIAIVRALDLEEVRALIHAHTRRPPFGLFGEARVSVLDLNLALMRSVGVSS